MSLRFTPCVPCAEHGGRTGRVRCGPCQHNEAVIEALNKVIEALKLKVPKP